MTDKQPKCPECATLVRLDFLYCPQCKANLKDEKIDKTMEGVSALISDTEALTSAQMSIIYKVFREDDNAKNDPSTAHLLEEKICHKFIRSVSESEYTVKDMVIIAKKILMAIRIPYSREY